MTSRSADSSPDCRIPAEALPADEPGLIAWIRLLRSRRVGPATFIRLISEHGSAQAALDALPKVAEAAGVHGYAPSRRDKAEDELAAGQAAGAVPLLLGAPDYPAALASISDPPPLLWALGDAALLRRPAVALVGARSASALGQRMASKLAGELGTAGLVVVSGLARGIDGAAHRATLDTGTIAVQAGGIEVVYPAEHADLASEIAECGLRLTEMPPGHVPRAPDFPRRNRIVSGLACAVVVVEGALKSGSLITARAALDQGRDVMAVPGHPMDARAGGCNALIRDGATLVRSAQDVLEALPADLAAQAEHRPQVRSETLRERTHSSSGQSRHAPAFPPPADGNIETVTPGGDLPDRLLALLSSAPVAEDVLIRTLELPAATVSAALPDLELEGSVRRHPGGMLSREPS